MSNETIRLTAYEEKELISRARSRTLPAGEVRRARLVLMLAEGKSYKTIQEELACDATFIVRWKKRFVEDRLSGLYARHPGREVEKRTPKMEARILEWTRRRPPDGSTHWSTRKLAKHLGVHHMMVARVWKRARLQPHRIERYMMSNDPLFEQKAADVIGLYVKPPQHAVVFCVDEKTSIQALDRLDPVLPLAPGRAERHGFEYYRHGTSLCTRRSTQKQEQSSAAPLCGIQVRSSLPFSPTSWRVSLGVARSISSLITSRLIKPNSLGNFWSRILM